MGVHLIRELKGDRILLSGRAVTCMSAEFELLEKPSFHPDRMERT